MFIPKSVRVTAALFMALIMTNIPHIAWAEAAQEMIPTTVVVDQLSRSQAIEKMQGYLNRADLRKEMVNVGLSPDEVSSRLASLSDSELRSLTAQMDQATYGGDVTGILVLVLLVILIIYLLKRI